MQQPTITWQPNIIVCVYTINNIYKNTKDKSIQKNTASKDPKSKPPEQAKQKLYRNRWHNHNFTYHSNFTNYVFSLIYLCLEGLPTKLSGSQGATQCNEVSKAQYLRLKNLACALFVSPIIQCFFLGGHILSTQSCLVIVHQ